MCITFTLSTDKKVNTMNIQDTTLMYPNDKLLPILSEKKYSGKLKEIARNQGDEQYDCFSFAVISNSVHESNIGKPVMLFSSQGEDITVSYQGETLECVSVVSEHGLTSVDIETGEQGVYFGAIVPKKWLRVMSFDEVESIIGVRPLEIDYKETPYSLDEV